ncbi:unnamed protein product [Larinioides sclopetarius]|uniref:Cytochrome P450 n=1 Tax=Larinioides sclopetarius TaxID=280406 RepID=A0AAV2A1B0_9ARAC
MIDPALLFGAVVAIFLVGISTITVFHWWKPRKYDYWKKNGLPFVDPSMIVNNEKPFNELLVERYHNLGPIYGYFEAEKPKISIGDPTLLKNILIKDFSFFMGRKPIVTGDEVHDKMLTIARGEDWKRIRGIVSPIFTTGKLKKMLHIFKNCSQVLMKCLKSSAEEGKSIDLKSIYGAFTTDVIAGAIFSAKVDSHDDPGNQFVKTARDVFGGKPGKRPTAIQLSMDELVGQCLIFFLAGYETTSSTLSFVTHILAHHQDVQDKLREEVAKVLAETNGELTYEAVQNMKYLDNVISETLRLYPPAIQLERYADADYKLEDKGITIPKGMGVTIPIYAIHRDSKIFSHPERFDPDRFIPEAKSMRNPYTYMPFGAGPRNCVGMRFALLEIKICLSYVVTKFRIKKTPHTKEELNFHAGGSGFLRPKEVLAELEIREDSFEIK